MTEFLNPAQTLRDPSANRHILYGISLFFLGLSTSLYTACAAAQQPLELNVSANTIQKRANGVLSLMAYSVVPDLASSSLSIQDSSSHDTTINMVQFAGGATISKSLPLYLEGGFALSRYDPQFVASAGTDQRTLPFKWNSITGTAGVGWDFPVAEDLVLRPIFNFALGRVESDLALGNLILGYRTGRSFDFLENGHLNAYGLGGSLMLDYEHYRKDYEVDVELRYTDIELRSFGGADSIQGSADARTASLWTRYRAPTGITMLDRPLRYVLEFSHSHYLGSQAGILGFDYLSTIGAGFELDSSAYDVYVTRTRLVMRYMFGDDVSGVSLGLALSF
ncbi:autotransporter domain-containing protein [Oxalicibacterium solurbis]|uniref:Autotransporter domain-containing protein n=1 Tax=Oxalicibacterium solurbis TaxID=69280 RepID=A0A8J3B1F4_9BURK|nr:autotransporter domain-containing protein [Oxalicibacterium solurbis]GGI53070.1 hypothetical protein GCM10011430_02440 [Oxalicibacterium solurbis]